MPRFIAMHTAPFTEEQLKELTKVPPSQIPAGVSWKLTYCDFDNNKFFCDWEAPNKETLVQIFKSLNVPCDAIYPVRIFDPTKAKLEP